VMLYCLWFYGCKVLEGIHPLEGGYLRRMYRRDRRPELPIESALAFYGRFLRHLWRSQWGILRLWWRFNRVRRQINADPSSSAYTDLALKPVAEEDSESLGLFSITDAAKAALRKRRQRDQVHTAMA